MAKRSSSKPTREELLRSLQSAEQRIQALTLLVKSEGPTSGWTFVHGPRNMSAFLIFVDEEGFVSHFDAVVGSAEWQSLTSSLYRQYERDFHLDSLLAAMKAAGAWRSRVFAPITIVE